MLNDPVRIGATTLVSGLRELADDYDAILCDVWGVVHNGQAAFTPACAALSRFRERGGSVALLTNAPRPRRPVFKQLAQLGVPRQAFDLLITSGDVTLSFIAKHGNAPVRHIGPKRDLALFEALREQTGFSPPRVGLDGASYVLCTGLDHDDVETPADYSDQLAQMRARSLDFICANPDLVVHVGDRLIYCAGALAAGYEQLGGRVMQAGKPHQPIYDRAMTELEQLRGEPVARSRTLAIGDAMRTDIKGASNSGIDALFITSGIHRDELHPAGARENALDHAAFEQFLQGADLPPVAALAALVW